MRYVQTPIDPRLTVDCEQPELNGDTWRDVAVQNIEQKSSIKECSSRMKAIRNLNEK